MPTSSSTSCLRVSPFFFRSSSTTLLRSLSICLSISLIVQLFLGLRQQRYNIFLILKSSIGNFLCDHPQDRTAATLQHFENRFFFNFFYHICAILKIFSYLCPVFLRSTDFICSIFLPNCDLERDFNEQY